MYSPYTAGGVALSQFMFINHIKKAPEHGQFNHYYQKLKHLD